MNTKLKIGSLTYEVDILPFIRDDEGHEALGRCDTDKLNIIISQDTNIPTPRILLHEVIHAIDYEYGLELVESQVRILANALYQVINDNDDFFE